jgi:hypothetical protein
MDVNGRFDTVVDDLKRSTRATEYTAPGWDVLEFSTPLSEQLPDIQSIKYYTIIPFPFPEGVRNVSIITRYIGCHRHWRLVGVFGKVVTRAAGFQVSSAS